MRGAPVEMEIDAVAVLRVGIFEIVGEAGRGRKFVGGRRIEIGVGAAEADRAVADTGIGEPRRTVIAGGSVVLGCCVVARGFLKASEALSSSHFL
jgi:hypothetical protein